MNKMVQLKNKMGFSQQKNGILSLLCIVIYSLLITDCNMVEPISGSVTTYVDTHQQSKDTIITYELPVITPAPQTQQIQTKGGVTISCNVVPFVVALNEKVSKNITYTDPKQPGYDIYETSSIPYYEVTPNEVQFKFTIRNGTGKILKLSTDITTSNAVLVVEKIDGVGFNIPSKSLDVLNNSMIAIGDEKTYLIVGPSINSLNEPKIISISLQDIPVEYNQAGVITKKDNFEWFFNCSREIKTEQHKISYNYSSEPIYKEQCKACNGIGYFEKVKTCGICNGKGSFVGTDGKTYSCSNCGSKGTIIVKEKCNSCSGKGVISYPKSPNAPIANSTFWRGWWVSVVTKPSGAIISLFNPNTLQYTSEGIAPSPNKVRFWYQPGSTQNPIIVSYNGKSVKVLPYTANGKQSPKINVDFLTGTEPIVKIGKKVE